MKKINKKMLIVSLLASLSAVSAQSVLAATSATASVQATATIASSCNLSIADLAFGAYVPNSGSVKLGSTTLTTTCSKGVSYVMKISAGSSGDANLRTLPGVTPGNTDKLGYLLSNDFAGTWILGDVDAGNSHTTSLVGTGAPAAMTIYGRIIQSQFVSPDSYAESLTVSLTY